jgi:hypothetical protein
VPVEEQTIEEEEDGSNGQDETKDQWLREVGGGEIEHAGTGGEKEEETGQEGLEE